MKKRTHAACALALALAAWPLARTGAAPRCYPNSAFRFLVLDGGLVRDTLTRLVWQRNVGPEMTWMEAQTYCSSLGPGFRLPTVKELESLLDLEVSSGAMIDQTAFPNTPEENFCTSTPSPYDSTRRWYISFGSAYMFDAYDTCRYRCMARCVYASASAPGSGGSGGGAPGTGTGQGGVTSTGGTAGSQTGTGGAVAPNSGGTTSAGGTTGSGGILGTG